MRFDRMIPMKIYNGQPKAILPKIERNGFGSAVFMLTKSQQSTFTLMHNPFIDKDSAIYRYYYVDSIYKERIGAKKILQNLQSVIKKTYVEGMSDVSIRYISYQSRKSILKNFPNVIVDLGKWMELYFTYRYIKSAQVICDDFMKFLGKRLSENIYTDYTRTVVIDIAEWFNNKTLSYSRNSLNDPVSIILLSLYKYPEMFNYIPKTTFMIMDSTTGQILRLEKENMVKDNYMTIKARLSMFPKLKSISEIDGTEDTAAIVPADPLNPDAASTDPSVPLNAFQIKQHEEAKQKIIISLKQNLLGDIEDMTNGVIENDDDYKPVEFSFENSDEEDEIERAANEFLDQNPELLDEESPDEVAKMAEDHIKKKVYISKFMPDRTVEELDMLEIKHAKQTQVIGLPSFQDMQSKMLDEADFSDYVATSNPNIVKSKYATFNASYNKKKMDKDIDEAVSALSNGSIKIFIEDKVEEDTSDQLNLKKTVSYTLRDEKGKKMTLKFDLPIIIDDTFMYINGSKKIFQHQRVLKPIVHTAPDAVQLVSSLQKIFITRKGQLDLLASSLKKFILGNADIFKVKYGNTITKNSKILTSLEFDIFAKNIYSFVIGETFFCTDIDFITSEIHRLKIPYKAKSGIIPIGYNQKSNEVITVSKEDSYAEKVLSFLKEKDKKLFESIKFNKKLMYAQATMMEKDIPLIVFMLFCDGFTKVMEKADIKYKFIPKEEASNYGIFTWGSIELKDGIIVWERSPMKNSLIMNGLQSINMSIYTKEELDSKETYIYILSQFYQYANMAFNLDQFKDFMIDPIMKEVLMDFGYPTDLIELMVVAAEMLTTNQYIPENSLDNMRIRSNELIAYHVYKEVTKAYNRYRKTQHKKNPTNITMKPNQIIQDLLKSKLVEDNSVLNPVLELEKNRSVTYKGESGINLEKSLTIEKRAYDESMLGVIGISTSPDSNVGVLRQLTLEPMITSTRGYIDVHNKKRVDELSAANLLTPAEMLTPLGVQHDDPTRTSMAYKQSKYMLLVDDADPVMIGNKVEAIIPYHTSDEFSVVAKDNGVVVDIKNKIVVIKYDNGSFQSIDTSPQIKKNSSSGFYIESILACNKVIGDKVKKGEVVAWNDKAFTKNSNDLSASMNLGVLAKIAIVPNWDIFEDSAPISETLSQRLSTTMISDKEVALHKNTFVQSIVSIGDEVKTGDPLITFDQSSENNEVRDKFLETLRAEMAESVINSAITTVKSGYSGIVSDIKIFSTVDTEELSPSLQAIVKENYTRIKKKEKVLDSYKNPSDSKYYKSGNLITESAIKITPDAQGKIKGVRVHPGVLIVFYIKYSLKVGKGDKICSEFALKSISSHVMPKGLEPYSEYRPDEEISSLVAPLSITARKTPSIFLAMFGNKLLIEFKRQQKEKYFKD